MTRIWLTPSAEVITLAEGETHNGYQYNKLLEKMTVDEADALLEQTEDLGPLELKGWRRICLHQPQNSYTYGSDMPHVHFSPRQEKEIRDLYMEHNLPVPERFAENY